MSVLAYTNTKSALGPLVIHILVPLRIYLSLFLTAVSYIEVTSEPELGSLIARDPTLSPLINLGKYFALYASFPLIAT
jgi:hypothetical protein